MRLSPQAAWVGAMRATRAVARRTGIDLAPRPDAGRWHVWRQSLLAVYDVPALAALDVPWWTFDSAARVADHLAQRPGARVFEWGTGASSVWLGRRAGAVHSVEHDPAWAEVVRPLLPPTVHLEVREPAPLGAGPAMTSHKRGAGGLDFTHYVRAIEAQDEPFDVVVIDGRAREHCLGPALDRLAPDGLVVFDNVDRARYRAAIDRFRDRLEVEVTRGLTPALPYPTRTALLRPVR